MLDTVHQHESEFSFPVAICFTSPKYDDDLLLRYRTDLDFFTVQGKWFPSRRDEGSPTSILDLCAILLTLITLQENLLLVPVELVQQLVNYVVLKEGMGLHSTLLILHILTGETCLPIRLQGLHKLHIL